MADKKTSNPFDIFQQSRTRNIRVKSLNDAQVEIKTSLTIAEEQTVKTINFENQETVGTNVIPNQADASLARLKTVSYILVEPKMTMTELGDLHGGEEAINEIYKSYMKYKEKDEVGN